MRKFNFKKTAAIAICTVILSGSVLAVSENNDIGIQVNGEVLSLDVKPFIENDHTLIPLRGVMEKLGARVEWSDEQKTVNIHTENMNIELAVGDNTAKVIKFNDGVYSEEKVQLAVEAQIVSDRTFIPCRFVTETLGASVTWNEDTKTVIIDTIIQGIEKPLDFEVVESDTLEENEALQKWYEDNYKTKGIFQFESGEWMYVLASAGEKPTGGYGLTIDSVTIVAPKTAYVYAVLTAPDKDSFVTQALTYPNEIIRFQKGDTEAVIWDLADSESTNNHAFFNSFTGTVKEINEDKAEYKTVFAEDKDGKEATFILSEDTYYLDDVKIAVGERITGYYEADKPMIMIYPPQYSIDVVTYADIKDNIKVDKFDGDLLSADKSLQLNLSEDTEIIWKDGSDIRFFAKPTANDLAPLIADKKIIVIYDFTTKSIPAQTTPKKIIVL